MREELESRSATLIISSAKLTARVLRAAIDKYLAHRKEKKITKARAGPVISHGKQTVKELVGQNAGVSNLEITDSNIKSFDRVARKYGVDYAVKKDRSVSPPKYLVFFKGRDADALTAAFSSPLPSFDPADLGVGILLAAALRLAVYIKGRNAKKFRKNVEYGSARWGKAEGIKPYIDPVFENSVILTQTERLTMNSRPKDPKTSPEQKRAGRRRLRLR